jgi:hypothetical protein
MIEEETAKRFRDNSPVKDKAATRSARFFIGYLCCRKKAFSRFIQDQIHALMLLIVSYCFLKVLMSSLKGSVCFFSIKRKERGRRR